MSIISSINYDPAASVSKSTATLLAMTALDTTNLRITFTAPQSRVLVRLQGVITGATTWPQVLFGVLDGATVVARIVPKMTINGTSLATTLGVAEVLFTVSGLTPGNSYTWDAAYGVDLAVASTNIRYGGPDNATESDAFGAFVFEVWNA